MRRISRRTAVGTSLAGLVSAPALAAHARQGATPAASPVTDPATAVLDIVAAAMDDLSLRAALVHVASGDEVIAHHAYGESLTGVPATPDMHIRNGAVAITYTAVLLMRFVDEGLVGLDDTIDAWMPDLPDADRVTLRMLAQMTSSYPDYVQNPAFIEAFYRNPFRAWTPEELIATGFELPRVFGPGENWYYAHTNYVILGLILEQVGGQPLDALLRQHILHPLALTGTASDQTAFMPDPALRAFTSERREILGIPSGTPFYEESTSWDPSWTVARGAVQYSTVADMASSFAAIGRGDLLSEASMRELLNSDLLGFGAPMDGCPSCRTFDASRLYGLGVWVMGGWIIQNPSFAGYAGVAAYHAETGIAIGIATTYAEEAFMGEGDLGNASATICARIAAALVPHDPVPMS